MAKLVYTDPSGRELTVPLGPESPVVSIGRATDCTVRSNRKSVSRNHAEFRYENGRYEVVDLNSSNGTYIIIDDRRQQISEPRSLSHGDEIWCGDFILRFYQEGSDSAPAPGLGQSAGQSQGGVSGAQPAVQQGGVSGAQPAMQQGGGFGAQAVEEMDSSTAREEAPSGMHGGVDFGALSQEPEPAAGADPEELERLRDEKASIQELADRQAEEVEKLQTQLEELRTTLDEARNDADFYRDQADEIRRAKGKLEGELEEAKTEAQAAGDTAALEEELERLRDEKASAEDRLGQAHEKIDDLRLELDAASEGERRARKLKEKLADRDEALATKKDRIQGLEKRIDRLGEQLDAAQSDTSEEELKQLREEVERQERLLAEYEGRNRDVQRHLDEVIQERDDLERSASDLEEALDRTTEARDEAQSKLERLTQEHAGVAEAKAKAQAENEELRESKECLQSEVEGLKQRLRLEKKRAREAEEAQGGGEEQAALEQKVEALQSEIGDLEEALESAEAKAKEAAETAEAAPAVNGQERFDASQLQERAQSLKRVVDAIERADLSELSTVDRVRLQSALRETSPREVLSAMLEDLVSQ